MEHELFMLLLNALGEKGLIALAGLGLLYVVVRVIVAVTPTHADDEALERGTSALRSIFESVRGVVLGGAKKPPAPPASPGSVASLLLALALCGCTSPGDQYQASAMAFSVAVDAATELRVAGKLEPREIEAIGAAVDEGHKALAAWAEALKADGDYPEAAPIVASAVSRIRDHLRPKGECPEYSSPPAWTFSTDGR